MAERERCLLLRRSGVVARRHRGARGGAAASQPEGRRTAAPPAGGRTKEEHHHNKEGRPLASRDTAGSLFMRVCLRFLIFASRALLRLTITMLLERAAAEERLSAVVACSATASYRRTSVAPAPAPPPPAPKKILFGTPASHAPPGAESAAPPSYINNIKTKVVVQPNDLSSSSVRERIHR